MSDTLRILLFFAALTTGGMDSVQNPKAAGENAGCYFLGGFCGDSFYSWNFPAGRFLVDGAPGYYVSCKLDLSGDYFFF